MTPSGEHAIHVLRQAQLVEQEEQAELRPLLQALKAQGPLTLPELARETGLVESRLCVLLLRVLTSGQVRSWTEAERGIVYGVLGEVV